MKRQLALVVLSAALLGAQQTSRSYSTYTPGIHGERVPGPMWSETKTPTGSERTLRMRSINNRMVPLESVRERVVRQDATGKVIERTQQLYDHDGRPFPPQVTRIEERRNPDGTKTEVRTTFQQDVNGRFQLVERSTSQIRETASGRRANTVVERPSLSGSLEAVERINSVEGRTATREQEQVVSFRKGIGGNFFEAARQVTERVRREDGRVTETVEEYEAATPGQLRPTKRTETHIRKLSDSSEVRESTVYLNWSAGRPVSASGGLQLSEQHLVERRPGPGDTVLETTSIRKPSLNFPHNFGKYEKVSEVVCRGHCRDDEEQ